MGFFKNLRQDPIRAFGHWYNQRMERKRLKKRKRAAELWEQSFSLDERLRGQARNDPYTSRYRSMIRIHEDRKKKRAIDNKAVKPWLYANLYGIPRMVDCMDLRRLAETPIAQLCISTKRSFVKNTPWMVVEVDPSEKQLKQVKATGKDRRRAIKRLRAKEVNRIMEMPVEERVRDGHYRELRKKAMDGGPQNPIIDEITKLLSKPNNTNRPFSHYTSMTVADLEEVGNATWVLKFLKTDMEEVMSEDGKMKYTRPKKGAKPVEFDAFDNLQFNKDEDDFGGILGYYHFPRGWSAGAGTRPRYMSKKEIVWFESDPRSNRPYGVGNTEKAAPDLDLDQLLLEQITTYAAEGLQSPGMLSLKGEGWTPEEFDKFKTYMQEEVKGHPDVFPIVDKEAQWIPFTQNFRESQYLERELWRAKNIVGQFQMNLTVVGLEDNETNRATSFAHITLALDLKGAGPMLKDIEHAINTQIVWRFFSPDKKISFLFDPALNAEERERTEVSAIRKWEAGLITKDEARSEMGHVEVGPDDGGDDFREEAGADTGLGLGGGFPGFEKSEEVFHELPSPKKKSEKQSIIFDKSKGWTREKALAYCKSHGYKSYTSRETEGQWRIRQFPSDDCKGDGYIIDIDEDKGISAYVCETSITDSKEKEDNGSNDLGRSEIEETDYNRLFTGVSQAYDDVFKALFSELGKPEYRELFDNAKGTKASPTEVLAVLVGRVVRNSGLVDKTVTSITKVVGSSVVDVVREQATELNLGLDDVDESAAIERFTQKRMSYYEKIPDTLSEDVLETLARGVKEGKSYQEVRNMLMEKREDFTRHRAEVIARTELGRSRREAKLIFAEKHENILVKVWRATRDHRTRKSHLAMDGKVANIKDPFIVNYSLDDKKHPSSVEEMVPGESKYGIQCRCSMTLRKK